MDKPILKSYYHVDNGGHTILVDEFGNVEIQTGFFGYDYCTMMLTGQGKEKVSFIEFLIDKLTEAKYMLKTIPTKEGQENG